MCSFGVPQRSGQPCQRGDENDALAAWGALCRPARRRGQQDVRPRHYVAAGQRADAWWHRQGPAIAERRALRPTGEQRVRPSAMGSSRRDVPGHLAWRQAESSRAETRFSLLSDRVALVPSRVSLVARRCLACCWWRPRKNRCNIALACFEAVIFEFLRCAAYRRRPTSHTFSAFWL